MSLRPSTICLLSLLFGCASADVAYDGALTAEEDAPNVALESANKESVITVMPGETVELTVRYRAADGASVAGRYVDFALAGMASGASLTPSRAPTDAAGFARTKLRAGSMSGSLQVRAGADGAKPVYVDVLVGDALPSDARVRVAYEGARELASYTITALEGATCEQALARGLSGDIVHRIEQPEETIYFKLPPGSRTAMLAWGSDDTGAPLARGCRDVVAPVTVDQVARELAISVPLRDVALRLEGELPVELALSLGGPAKRISETALRAAQKLLSPSGRYTMFAEADFYLDAVARTLRERESSDALVTLDKLRATTTLASSLAPALTRSGLGPLHAATRLGESIAARGSILVLSSSLKGAQLGPVRALNAQTAEGTDALTLDIAAAASLSARFDEVSAELVVDALRIELGVGQYGRALLSELQSADESAFTSALDASGGCSEVLAPWAQVQLANVCDRECAIAACQSALSSLVDSVEAGLLELDAQGGAITLTGRLPAHDRTDDGRVDDVGPAQLDGSWSPSDTVSGELREPARNALTL